MFEIVQSDASDKHNCTIKSNIKLLATKELTQK